MGTYEPWIKESTRWVSLMTGATIPLDPPAGNLGLGLVPLGASPLGA